MKNTKTIIIRFNLDNSTHRFVWKHLNSIDKGKYRSRNAAVIEMLSKVFGIDSEKPFLETSEKDDIFITKIVDRLESSISRKLSEFLSDNTNRALESRSESRSSVSDKNDDLSLSPEKLKQLEEIAADKAIMDFLGG